MAVGDAHAFLGFFTPVLTQLSFQSYRLLFSHALEEVRGENTPQANIYRLQVLNNNNNNKSGKLSQDTPVLPQVEKMGHAPNKIQV